MKRLAGFPVPPSASGLLEYFLHQFSVFSLFQALPSFPLAVGRQAILGNELPSALVARGTPPQSQSRRLAVVGSKLPGPRSESLRCARRSSVSRLVPSGAHLPLARHAHSRFP